MGGKEESIVFHPARLVKGYLKIGVVREATKDLTRDTSADIAIFFGASISTMAQRDFFASQIQRDI